VVSKEDLVKKYDEYYAKDKGKWSVPERNKLAYDAVKRLKESPAEILDIGCGNGHTLEYFHEKYPDAKLYGLDLSPKAIEIAKEKLPDDATFYTEFLTDLSARKKFDLILCLGTAEHFEDLSENLAKVKSLLKKDGIAYFEMPNNLAYDYGLHNFRQLRSGSRQYEWHLNRKEWNDQLTQAGFEIVKEITHARPQWQFAWILR